MARSTWRRVSATPASARASRPPADGGTTGALTAFNPSYIGLRPASDAQLAQVAKDFRVYYAKSPGKTPGDYTMDHTAASYVFDKDGKLRLFARDGQGVEPWVHDLKLLID